MKKKTPCILKSPNLTKPRRVIDIFDDDGNGEVDFKEFIMGLSHFRFIDDIATLVVS